MLEMQEALTRLKHATTPYREHSPIRSAIRTEYFAFKAEYDNAQLPRFIKEANAQEDY